MKKVLFICPICETSQLQEIPQEIMEERNKNVKDIVTILIPENSVCKHMFLVYVDKNFCIRDTISVENVQTVDMKTVININDIKDIIKKLSAKSINTILRRL